MPTLDSDEPGSEPYADRREAGLALARRLATIGDLHDAVVLALPRGGVPVGYEIARALEAPLDVFLVRKLGVPGQPELALGAIASGGVRVLNPDVVAAFAVPKRVIEDVARQEQEEFERREAAYRERRPAPSLSGRLVILVDDGLATGASMKAAVEGVRSHGPRRVVVAAPVGSREACRDLASVADEVVCLSSPADFVAVGLYYRDFSETTDDDVRRLLHERAAASPGPAPSPAA